MVGFVIQRGNLAVVVAVNTKPLTHLSLPKCVNITSFFESYVIHWCYNLCSFVIYKILNFG